MGRRWSKIETLNPKYVWYFGNIYDMFNTLEYTDHEAHNMQNVFYFED